MHVIQGTEFVALGHSNGSLTIHNLLNGNLVRKMKISDQHILEILMRPDDGKLHVLTKESTEEMVYYQYDWKSAYYVENRLQNQDTCVSSCESKQYKASAWLACRTCNASYRCADCNADGCITCHSGYFLDSITNTSGVVVSICTSLCSQSYFGLSFDNSNETKCVEICPSDIYNTEYRTCSLSTSISSTSEQKGVTATIKLASQSETVLVDFSREVSFNTNHILSSTSSTATYIQQCVFLEISNVLGSQFTYTTQLSSSLSTILEINITLNIEGGIKDPTLKVTFDGQTCFKDVNSVPLSIDLINDGLTIVLPFNIVAYDPNEKKTAEDIGTATKALGTAVAAAAIPLFLMNLMYVFWILINVFQLVNFLLYLNVKYPVNITSFFRAFKSFSMDFLPNLGESYDEEKQEYSFLGTPITDQTPAAPFVREGMTSSFYLNGLKFLQTYFYLYIVLYIVRIIARHMKVRCRAVPADASFFYKIIALAQQKLEFTMIITTHQSSMLKLSVAIFLQMMGFSSSNAMNIIGFLISIFGFGYLVSFIRNCYQKVNQQEMVVGSKIQEKVMDQQMREKYEKFQMQYGVLYFDVNFIFYMRRNYHVFSMIRQALIPFIVVFFNSFTFTSIFILIAIYILNAIFLILYRPYDRKLVGYLNATNDICMTIILCLIFYIHTVNENSGSIISADDVQKTMNIGWVIIGFLLILFAANIITGIALEWKSIKEAIANLKSRLKQLTKKDSVDSKDAQEAERSKLFESEKSHQQYLSSQSFQKIQQQHSEDQFQKIFQQVKNKSESKKNTILKDSLRNRRSNERSDSSNDEEQHRKNIVAKMQELSQIHETENSINSDLNNSHKPLNSPTKLKLKKKISGTAKSGNRPRTGSNALQVQIPNPIRQDDQDL